MVGVAMLYSGIALTVSGVSRCVTIEGYAAASLVPAVGGSIGVALSYDAPVVAEACGVAAVAAVEEVDARVSGRGLYYSSPMLSDVMARLALESYSESVAEPVLDKFASEPGYEALAASLLGSSIVVGGTRFPLPWTFDEAWVVAVRLKRHVPGGDKLVLRLLADPVGLLEALEEGPEALQRLLASARGRIAEKLVAKATRAGADAAFIDTSGRIMVVLAEGPVAASIVSRRLAALGDRYEAPLVV